MGHSIIPVLFVAIICGMFGYFLIRGCMPRFLALFITISRFAIPFIYFAWYYNPLWNVRDDLWYFWKGTIILESGFNSFFILFSHLGQRVLFAVTGSSEIVYPWFNSLAQYLFGVHYYSSVFLVIAFTFLSARVLYHLILEAGFDSIYAMGVLILSIFHWQLVGWTFLNMRDPLVLMLIILSFYFIIRLTRHISIHDAVFLIGIFLIFLWLRFYVPVLIVSSTLIWLIFNQRGLKKIMMIMAAGALSIFIIAYIGYNRIMSSVSHNMQPLVRHQYFTILYDMIHFILTPRPWKLPPHTGYMLPASWLHWALLPFSLIGILLLYRRSREFRLCAIFMAIVIFFYGSFPIENGFRYRLQFDFVLAWAQFHFFWTIFHLHPPDKALPAESLEEFSRNYGDDALAQ